MAISDQSIYNTYIARTLTSSTTARDLTVGTMPEEKQQEIVNLVKEKIKDNNGKVPSDLYGTVADILSPYVPGMSREALSGVLRSNGILGLGSSNKSITSVGAGLEKSRSNYEKKLTEINSRTASQFSTAEEEGSLNSAARSAAGTEPPPADGGENLPPAPEITGPEKPSSNPPSIEIVNEDLDPEKRSFVSSVEELEYEMGSTDRDISEMIIHWSETFQNANLNGRQVKTLTGAGDKEYHYIIKRDGSIERGVPIKKAGNHTRGHNKYSIGVCLVGGLKVPSTDLSSNSSRADLYEVGAESLTRSQYNTLYEMFRVFFTQYPGGQALGHSEIDPLENDPGFEVRDYVYNLFNKQSLYIDPQNESEKSPQEVLQAIDGEGPTVNQKDNTLLDQKF